MIEIRDIKIVTEIADSGSIHLAARNLGLSQPALTKRLHAIEERLQARLFHRQPRGVRPTRLGEYFLAKGADLVLHAQDVFGALQLQKSGQEGSFRLGVKPGLHDVFFRQSLIEFSAEHPKVRLEIVSRSTPSLCEDVKCGRLDLAIVGLGYSDNEKDDPALDEHLHFQPMFHLPLDLVVRLDHPYLESAQGYGEILAYPVACPEPPLFMLRNMEAAAEHAGIEFDGPRILFDDYDFILRLVSCSDFWTAIFRANREAIESRNQFVVLPAEPVFMPMTIGIVRRRTWAMPASAETFIDVLRRNGSEYTIETPIP